MEKRSYGFPQELGQDECLQVISSGLVALWTALIPAYIQKPLVCILHLKYYISSFIHTLEKLLKLFCLHAALYVCRVCRQTLMYHQSRHATQPKTNSKITHDQGHLRIIRRHFVWQFFSGRCTTDPGLDFTTEKTY